MRRYATASLALASLVSTSQALAQASSPQPGGVVGSPTTDQPGQTTAETTTGAETGAAGTAQAAGGTGAPSESSSTATQPPPASEAGSDAAGAAETHTPNWYERLKFEGLADAYFMYNFSNVNPRDPNVLRAYDTQPMNMTLAYAKIAMQLPTDPVGFRLDIGFGPVAEANGPLTAPYRSVLVPIQQAYVSFKIPSVSWLTFDFGKFVTTAGAEYIEAKSNWNYSRSLLFTYGPYTHTGLRVNATVNEHFALQASVVNGWDLVFDNNSGKTFGLAGTFDSGNGTTAAVTIYTGPEQTNNTSNWRFYADTVLGQAIGSNLNLMLNASVGYEAPDISWWGIAGYVRYKICECLRLAVRGEYYSDPNGARFGFTTQPMTPGATPTPLGVNVFEITATAGVPIGDNLELRAEYRSDFASEPVFAARTSSEQHTLTAAALAWF